MSMASTSNQTDSSISSTPHCDHDVFLSFRGPDTRNSFTSHLHDALTRSGIRTFIDDEELRSGKEIKPELRKAIQRSRMSIIVFSKNYASSRWCLDELVEILACRRTNGQIVIPIFYHVDPSVVRHQSGSYAQAFQHFVAVLEERKLVAELELKRMEKWRAALTEAANLSGHDIRTEENGNEARFIAKIVSQLEVNLRSVNVPESPVIVYSNFNCINTLLSIGSEDVRTIGICGIGGIGKTTVSKDLYYKYLNHFDCSAFVEKIKDVSKLPDGLLHLQQNILSQLQNKEKSKPPNSYEGINLIKKICCSRRVLILLDDLDDFDQIKKLVGQNRWFSAGSRVIIVTRDKKLLEEAQVDHIYEMEVLDGDKSLELFKRHAFGEETPFPPRDYKSLSIETTKYCEGLPLALEVIGRYMRGKTPSSWKKSLEEFRKCPDKSILDRLKISYDALSEHGKKIFLDVACIFIGWDKDYLVKFWDGCGFSPENSIRELSSKCLLKVDEKNYIRMHDHLRDMGRAIVLEASDPSLEKHSRVWIHEEVKHLLKHPKGAGAVEGLSYLRFIALETKALEAMHQLRFLIISHVDVTGSFEHLSGKLRLLSWRCPLKILPTDFHPRELVVLDLKWSQIKKPWEGVKHLNNLRILDLSNCQSLEETPNFIGVQSLERLMLRGCVRLSTIDPSIRELRSLEELDLEGCSMLERLPEELGNMKRLKRLMLRCCKRLSTIDPSICKLNSLEELDLESCSLLERLPEELGNNKSLKTLNVRHTLLERLPDSIGQLSRLIHLHLVNCKELKTLPTTICNLISLERLDVSCCSKLKRLPEGMGNLKRLRILNAAFTKLEELPDSIGHLSSLVHLDLRNTNINTLPNSICDLSSLEVLNIRNCRLQQLPDRLGNLVSLRDLDAYNIWCQLPDSIENLKKLERLTLAHLRRDPQLRFVLSFKIKSSLTTLKLVRCGLHDEDIPDDIGICLLSLQSLDLYGNDFCNLPSTLCQLSNLTDLNLSCCESLVSLPELPPNLHILRASRCTAMEKIPNLSNLKHLLSLDLSDSNRLVEVQGLENLKLRSLHMAGCNDLAMNTTFNASFFQRCFEGYLPSISLPKWNFQNWIIFQSMESTISFELPPSLPDNFQGIILWVVYAQFSFGHHRAHITHNTSGKTLHHDVQSSILYRPDIYCLGGHSWVSCIKSNFRSGDSIKISIPEDNYVKVEKCGVHWFIGSEGDEDENESG